MFRNLRSLLPRLGERRRLAESFGRVPRSKFRVQPFKVQSLLFSVSGFQRFSVSECSVLPEHPFEMICQFFTNW